MTLSISNLGTVWSLEKDIWERIRKWSWPKLNKTKWDILRHWHSV